MEPKPKFQVYAPAINRRSDRAKHHLLKTYPTRKKSMNPFTAWIKSGMNHVRPHDQEFEDRIAE